MTYPAKKINHANKEHIGAPYRAAYRKFATEILKEVQLKDLHSHEINLKGKVRDTNHIYRILPLPPGRPHEPRVTRNGPVSTPNGESLGATAEPWAHMEPSGVDPNSQMMRTLTPIPRIVRPDSQIKD